MVKNMAKIEYDGKYITKKGWAFLGQMKYNGRVQYLNDMNCVAILIPLSAEVEWAINSMTASDIEPILSLSVADFDETETPILEYALRNPNFSMAAIEEIIRVDCWVFDV